jgi:hypothetical protein
MQVKICQMLSIKVSLKVSVPVLILNFFFICTGNDVFKDVFKETIAQFLVGKLGVFPWEDLLSGIVCSVFSFSGVRSIVPSF